MGEDGTDEYGGVRKGTESLGLAAELENEQDLDIKQAFPQYNSFQAAAKLLELKNRETGDTAQINKTQRKKILSSTAIEKSVENGFTEEDYILIPYIVKSKNVSYAGKDSTGQD